MKLVDPIVYRNYQLALRRKQMQIPSYISKLLLDLNLNNYATDDEKASVFLKAILGRVKYTRAKRIFEQIKVLQFPTTTLIPNYRVFDLNRMPFNKTPQLEIVKLMFDYIRDEIFKLGTETQTLNAIKCRLYEPLLFSYYTGLRSFEVVQITAHQLKMLAQGSREVAISRKGDIPWNPIYHTVFNEFIQFLVDKYREQVNYEGLDTLLWNCSPVSLANKFKSVYTKITGKLPDAGFGLHIVRHVIATRLHSMGKIGLAQHFLGHKNVETTRKYIHVNEIDAKQAISIINEVDELYAEIFSCE